MSPRDPTGPVVNVRYLGNLTLGTTHVELHLTIQAMANVLIEVVADRQSLRIRTNTTKGT
jgi:hypothetical protein